jgi:hypothetical protein
MKYKHIRYWTQRYADWLKENNHDPAEYIAKRWLRDEIDELRECIEEIQFPRWVGLTEEDLERLADDVQWQHLWDHLGDVDHLKDFARAVEFFCREKNEIRNP